MKFTTLNRGFILLLILIVGHQAQASAGCVSASGSEYKRTEAPNGKKISKKKQKKLDALRPALPPIDTATLDTLNFSALNDERKAQAIVAKLRKEGVNLDSVSVDSLARVYFTDTISIRSGILPSYNVLGRVGAVNRLGDLIREERISIAKAEAEAAGKNRFYMARDSISIGAMSATSVVLPGFGQIYNKQYWKLPILYGGIGGFIGGAVAFNKKYHSALDDFNEAVASGATQHDKDLLNIRYNRYKTGRTLMYVGAAATYMYFLADAVTNYHGDLSRRTKATYLALMFPGAGQVYNGSYWKLPVLYGGFAALGYVIHYNNRGYARYKTAYNAMTDDDPNTVDEFNGRIPAEQLRNTRNNFRRYRDMGIFFTAGLYLLSVIEAYVDASLQTYDISDDLSVRVEPVAGPVRGNFGRGGNNNNMVGMSMKLTF